MTVLRWRAGGSVYMLFLLSSCKWIDWQRSGSLCDFGGLPSPRRGGWGDVVYMWRSGTLMDLGHNGPSLSDLLTSHWPHLQERSGNNQGLVTFQLHMHHLIALIRLSRYFLNKTAGICLDWVEDGLMEKDLTAGPDLSLQTLICGMNLKTGQFFFLCNIAVFLNDLSVKLVKLGWMDG